MGLLAIVFITLKLTGYVAWSWWEVTAPLWGSALLVVAILVGILVVYLWGHYRDEKLRKKRLAKNAVS